MKRITIGGQEYTIEFSLEATLYNECTEKVMDMITSASVARAKIDNKEINAEEKTEIALKTIVTSAADIPNRALILFYAGLLEHHGTESGDGSIKSKKDAKKLMKEYIDEHEGMNLYDVMSEMMEEIMNDHFFEQIGADKMMENANKQIQNHQVKTPQDHKRKGGNN